MYLWWRMALTVDPKRQKKRAAEISSAKRQLQTMANYMDNTHRLEQEQEILGGLLKDEDTYED